MIILYKYLCEFCDQNLQEVFTFHAIVNGNYHLVDE